MLDSTNKLVVIDYLRENLDKILESRKLNGFSWKPYIKEIVTRNPGIGLDPENESHRDKIRHIFVTLSKGKVKISATVLAKTPELRKLAKDLDLEISSYVDTYNRTKKTPESEEEEFRQWKAEKDKLKNQVGLHVVLGCVHLPAVNKPFFNALISFLKDIKADLKGIHLIGDILDCKSLSSHDIGQISDTTLEQEYKEANKYLDILDSILPEGIEKNYIYGNHEDRYFRVMKKVDMAKFGGALLSPTKGCRFLERGYTVQEDYKNARIQLGKYLDLIHGDYVSVNPAKKHLDVHKKSIMFAHTHKMGTYFDSDKAAFNIGWMGDPENSAFNYVGRITRSQWQNGFAVVNIDNEGFYHVQVLQYYNGKFFFGGKEYK